MRCRPDGVTNSARLPKSLERPTVPPPDSKADLSALMRAANAGDAVAYRQVLASLAGLLRAHVRRGFQRFGRGPEDVEDVVQDALLAVHLKRHTWDAAQPLEPWVRAIAHYKLIDHLRRRGSVQHIDLDDVADVLPADANDGAAAMDSGKLLAQLSDRQRRIVEAISLQGRTTSEVAREMDMTEVAVRVTLHRAIKAMGEWARRGGT